MKLARQRFLSTVIRGATDFLISISGTVTDGVNPVSGVLVTFGQYSAITGADGTYTIRGVPSNTTAILTPTKANYLFNLSSISITTSQIIGNLNNQNFTAFLPLLYESFTTPLSAPLASPHASEPGPGSLDFMDAGNIESINNGDLVINGTASGSNTGFIQHGTVSRLAGRTFSFYFSSIINSGLGRVGLNTSIGSTMVNRNEIGTTSIIVYETSISAITAAWTIPQIFTIIQRPVGAFLVVGSRLVWVDRASSANANPMLWFAGAQTPNLKIANVSTIDLVSVNADSKLYTQYVASPTNGLTATMDANAIIEFDWTPASNEILILMFRRTDDNNTLKLICDQAAGTIRLYKRISGVDTELTGGTTVQTWTVASVYRITIIAEGTSIQTNVNVNKKNQPSAEAAQKTATGVKISGFTLGSNLYCWRSNLSSLLPDFLIPSIPPRYYLVIGDSKSVNNVWETPFESLINSPTAKWQTVGRLVNVGWSVYATKNAIDSFLGSLSSSPVPEFLCLNLGTNDVNGDIPNDVFYNDTNQDGAEWTANLQYILDAVHTKWPSCQCYIMRPWKPDTNGNSFQTKLNLIGSTLLLNAINGRAWAHLGPDERQFLENGDDGATYIEIGTNRIHPNTAGYQLTAQQWKTTLGL